MGRVVGTQERHLPWAPVARMMGRASTYEMARRCRVQRRTIYRWREQGWVSIRVADRLAVALGHHPIEIWGAEWEGQ